MSSFPPLHLAFITSEFVTERKSFDGGLAQYLGRLSQALVKRGHSVEVFVIGDADETREVDGVFVNRVVPNSKGVESFNRQTCRLFRRPMYTFFENTFHHLTIAASLRAAFLKRHADAPFHLIQATNLLAAPLFLGRSLSPVPVVVRLSSDLAMWNFADDIKLTRDEAFCQWLVWQSCRRVGRLYAPSEFLARQVASRHRLFVDVIRPTFELERIEWDWSEYEKHSDGKPYLLFHGTISRLKGTAILVEALETALQRDPEVRMLFIGKDGTMGAGKGTGVELLQERLGRFGDRVRRLDRLPHAQLYPFLSRARGSVLPSLMDNLPNTALEAMALGRAVIGTRGASFEELIEHGESGLLVDVGDSQGLAGAIGTLWQMPEEERREMGAVAQKKMEQFAPERTIPILENFYRDALGDSAMDLGNRN